MISLTSSGPNVRSTWPASFSQNTCTMSAPHLITLCQQYILWGPNLPHALKVWLLCANHSTWINQSHSKNEQTPQGSNGSDVGGPAVHDAPGQKASRWKMEWNGTCRAKQWNLMEWGNTLQGNGATQGNEMELTRQRRQPSLLLPCQDRCSTLINFQMEQGFIKVYNGRGS